MPHTVTHTINPRKVMYMTEVDEVVYTETPEYPIETFLDWFNF